MKKKNRPKNLIYKKPEKKDKTILLRLSNKLLTAIDIKSKRCGLNRTNLITDAIKRILTK